MKIEKGKWKFLSTGKFIVVAVAGIPMSKNPETPLLGGQDKQSKMRNTLQPPGRPRFFRLLVFLSCLGGYLFGYDTGIVSGAMVLVTAEFTLNALQHESVVSATIFTAIIGAAASVPINYKFGRRPCIILASGVFVIGSLSLSFATSFETLLVGRLVLGVGVGLTSMTVPMYIAEVAPSENRGTLVTLNTLFLTGGQFVASLTSAGFATWMPVIGWRWMFGLGALPAGIQMFGFFFFMPESPRWLLLKGKTERARTVFMQIRGVSAGRTQDGNLISSVEDEFAKHRLEDDEISSNWSFRAICRLPHVRRALLLGVGIQILQQIVGINTVMYYGATIVQMAGFSDPSTAIYANVGLAMTNFLFTIVGLVLVDRIGRRPLLLGSLAGVVLSLGLLGGAFYLNDVRSAKSTGMESTTTCGIGRHAHCFSCVMDQNCGFCTVRNGTGMCLPLQKESNGNLNMSSPPACSRAIQHHWSAKSCDSVNAWAAVSFLVAYLVFFAPGMGPMPWTLNSEIYPREFRSLCVGISTSANWVANLLISFTFLSLIEIMSAQGAFWFYGSIGIVGFFLLNTYMPETRGIELSNIEHIFMKQEQKNEE